MAYVRYAPGGQWTGADINNGKIQIDMPVDPAHYDYTDEHQSYWINLADWISGIIVDTAFIDLEDTPASYSGQALKLVRVNATATGLEFVDGATLYMKVDGTNSDIDYLDFDLTPATAVNAPGRLWWNETELTLSLGLPDGGSYEINQTLEGNYTASGFTPAEGDIVSIITGTGTQNFVELTDPTDQKSSYACIGMITAVFAGGSGKVRVTKGGKVNNINTNSFNEGDVIYVDAANPGKWTTTRPASPNYTIIAGAVSVKSATVGVININLRIIPRLEDLSNVNYAQLLVSNLGLFYDTVTGQWNAKSPKFYHGLESCGAPSITILSSIIYGYLYNRYVLTDSRNICASGWHIPTKTEYETLITYLGGSSVAGGKLKETGTTYWETPNNASNSALFNLRPTWLRNQDGTWDNYFPTEAYVWTGTQQNALSYYDLYVTNTGEDCSIIGANNTCGLSLRIIKDSTTLTNGQTGTYTGNDGRVYRTICIGTQEWIADNLAETKYRNGDTIPTVTDNSAWAALTTGAKCAYNNDESYVPLVNIIFNIATSTTYWYKGTRVYLSTAITCDVDSFETLTANTLYYFYFDDATGTLKCSDSQWNLKETIPTFQVFWNGSEGAIMVEKHNHTRDIDWHINAHTTIGTRYGSGLSMTYPDSANDANLQIESGSIWDEDQNITIAQQTTCRGIYKVSASVYTFANYALPYVGTSGQPQYLDTDTYALTNVGASDFVVMWYYATNDYNRPIWIIPTHAAAAYNTIGAARAETIPALSGLNLSPEMKLIYKVIYKGDGQFQEYVDYRNSSSLPAGGVPNSTAASTSFSPTTYTTSTNVQAAIEEVQDDALTEYISMACSDVSTALTTGTNKANFAFNFNFTLLAVFGKLDTVCTGSSFIFDINNGANSFLSTKLSIDASENTSLTAATPAVIDATYQDYTAGTKITVDFDQVGATIAGAGAGIILKVRRTS